MLTYSPNLRFYAKNLRNNMTASEECLWYYIRRKQLLNVQFYRQKPIGQFMVDFYAPSVGLIIEIDGSQHREPAHQRYDEKRTLFLESSGFRVLRFIVD